MGIFRLYSGDDGESHMEELDLASHPELSALHDAKGVVFRSTPPGSFSDWHTAPRRQYIITLSGEAEIGLGDGEQHVSNNVYTFAHYVAPAQAGAQFPRPQAPA